MIILFGVWLAVGVGCGQSPGPTFVFPEPTEQLLSELDADGSGAVTWDELSTSLMTQEQFAALDADGDGQVTVEELKAQLSQYAVHAPPGAGKKGKGPPRNSKAPIR